MMHLLKICVKFVVFVAIYYLRVKFAYSPLVQADKVDEVKDKEGGHNKTELKLKKRNTKESEVSYLLVHCFVLAFSY